MSYLFAQVRPNVTGFTPPSQSGLIGIADSSFVDSLDLPEIDIKPDLKFADRQALFRHKPFLLPVSRDIRNVLAWDPLDLVPGFVAQLGQIGKPHMVIRDGLQETILRRDLWRNPVFDNYNRYIFDAVFSPQYFDTKTPYISIDFMQGPQGARRLNTATVNVSQNISPNWNAHFFYNRKRAFGRFPNNETDLQSVYLSSYWRSKNKRYQAFATYSFSENKNDFNGGISIGPDSAFQVLEGSGLLVQSDSLIDLTFAQGKDLIPTVLEGASSNRILRSIYTDQYYHLIGHPDSGSANILTLRGAAMFEKVYHRFNLTGLSSSDSTQFANSPVPILPTWNTDSSFVNDVFDSNQSMLVGEASYTLDGFIRLHADGGITIRRLNIIREDGEIIQDIFEPRVHGELQIPRLIAEIDLDQRFSDLFEVQTRLSLRAVFTPFEKKSNFKEVQSARRPTLDTDTQGKVSGIEMVEDSIEVEGLGVDSLKITDSLRVSPVDSMVNVPQDTLIDEPLTEFPPSKEVLTQKKLAANSLPGTRDSLIKAKRPPQLTKEIGKPVDIQNRAPIALEVEYDQFDLNPSIFQGHFDPPSTNSFLPNPDLVNENVTRFAAQLNYRPAAIIRNGDTLLPNFSSIRVFVSRVGQPIYYSDELEVLQGGQGENYTWIGAELSARQHLFWWLYAQGTIAWQNGSSSAGASEALSRYAEYLPEYYAKASLFFDHRTLSIADVMHIGVDIYFNAPYTGFTVDPISQEFFPTRFRMNSSLRLDGYFALKLGPAYAYIKVIHANEAFPDPTYFTAPLYPMMERTITLGLNWVFFD